jgi:hypothetical protein
MEGEPLRVQPSRAKKASVDDAANPPASQG